MKEVVAQVTVEDEGYAEVVRIDNRFAITSDSDDELLSRTQLIHLAVCILEVLATDDEAREVVDLLSM